MTTSAYMIAHSDDDFLDQAIASVIDRVDELVFVDGAYKWVAPFFEKMGIDPERSWQKTHDILSKYGSKIKYHSGIWDDELHKRSFGYDQCEGDVIIRIDADEIFQFDDAQYDAFLASDKGVAEMEFPFLLTPESQRLQAELNHTPKQCAVFKAGHFRSPLDHCAYLWLVLTPEERARCREPNWEYLYGEPIIKTAHLTAFRTPRTSVNRARFYTLQYIRTAGHLPWAFDQTPVTRPEDKIPQIFNLMTADEYSSFLEGHDIVSGFANMQDFRVTPYSFDGPVQAQVEAAFSLRNNSVAALLDFTDHPRVVVSKAVSMVDVTSLVAKGVTKLEITTEDALESCSGHLYFLLTTADDQIGKNLAPAIFQTEGRTSVASFAAVDMSRVLQAVLMVCPVTPAPLKKTRITGLQVLT